MVGTGADGVYIATVRARGEDTKEGGLAAAGIHADQGTPAVPLHVHPGIGHMGPPLRRRQNE